MKENVREEERDTTTHLIKIPVFTHASRVTKFSVYILRPRQRSKKFRLVGPDYKGSEAISKLTKGPQNGAETFCGATGSFVSCRVVACERGTYELLSTRAVIRDGAVNLNDRADSFRLRP